MSTEVNPRRVASLLIAARNLFGTTGRRWVQGDLKIEMDDKPGVYAFCAAGAIREVEGYTEAERLAAEKTLAELIAKSSGEDLEANWLESLEYYEDYELENLKAQGMAESFVEAYIFNANDSSSTKFEDVRGWFNRAIARLKR